MFYLKTLGIVLALVLGAKLSWAQTNPLYATATIPEALQENAHAVVRQEERVLTIESPRAAYLSCRKVVTILNASSQEKSCYIGYDKATKVKTISAKLYDKTGKLIRTIKASEIGDFSSVSDFSIYEDDRYKYVEVTHNAYPYTIEFEYGLAVKGMYMCHVPNWYIQDYQTAIEQATYQIQLPKEMDLHYQALNIATEPEIETEKEVTYTWTLNNLTAKNREEWGPNRAYILPRLLVSLDQFKIGKYEGSFRSWEAFGGFIHQLAEGRTQLSASMRTQVQALTAKAANNREKIDILYRYLQQNMRYVSVQLGIGGWQPFDAQYVETNKYGDCKALTNFMKAMLEAVGIPSHPVLIYNGTNAPYALTEDFTTSMFNHVILRIPEEDIWLECTNTNFPVNYIGAGNANRTALMVTENGGELIQTPQYTALDNAAQHQVQIHLDETGSASLTATAQLSGPQQDAYRYMATHVSQEKFEAWHQHNSGLSSTPPDQVEFKIGDKAPHVELNTKWTVERYASKTGKRLFVPINKVTALTTSLKQYKNRAHPVVIAQGFVENDQFEFHLPEGYKVESLPSNTTLETPFGRYTWEVEQQQDRVTVKRYFMLQATQQPADQYVSLYDFFKEIAQCDAYNMVLVKKS